MLVAKHMPKGPKGQKRPADVIGNAVTVMKIATGEIEESGQTDDGKLSPAGNRLPPKTDATQFRQFRRLFHDRYGQILSVRVFYCYHGCCG